MFCYDLVMQLKRTFNFKGKSSAGIWNLQSTSRLWRLYHSKQGWHGWPLQVDERPLGGQHFATRRDLIQAIALWEELNQPQNSRAN